MRRWPPILAALLVGGAMILDGLVPPEPAALEGTLQRAVAGVVSCPNVQDASGSGSVHLAAVEQATVRVAFLPVRGRSAQTTFTMPAGSTKTVRVPASVRGRASALVRSEGGPVAVSHTLTLPRSNTLAAGLGAAACTRADGSTIAVGHLRTLGTESVVSVFNPGSGSATVSITLNADGKEETFALLSGQLVLPRKRRDFRVGDFVFDAKNVTAVIRSDAGRIVAEALVRSNSGVGLASARPPSRSLVATSARSGRGASFTVGLVGDDDAGLDARLISTTEQGRAGRLPSSIAPGGGARIAIPDRNEAGPVAYAAALSIGSPVVASTAWERTRRGVAEQAINEGMEPAERWLGVAGVRTGGRARALLVNPGTKPAHVVVILAGGTRKELDIEGGRVVSVSLGRGPGTVSVLADSTEPIVVSLEASGPTTTGAWNIGMPAVPFTQGEPVAVTVDPRLGVPAPLRADQ